ncbi:MAG: septum site-determining protein MinC [Anaerolineae bacterium]|nr:septum site-determining protein MinC [Anaerolineae bacterium]
MSDIEQKVRVEIKGVQNALLVTLGEGDWADAERSILARVEAQNSFFKGARMAVDVGERSLRAAELGSFRDHLSDLDVTLWAVLSSTDVTEETARRLGLATRLPGTATRKQKIAPVSTEFSGESGILLRKTMRSGFKVTHPGHITVIGDVNAGAEIIAGGDVVVWGRLRGMVHAGADGNHQAMVCALELTPMQLRIADKIAVPPRRKKGEVLQPEIARIANDQVVAEPWNFKE